VIGNATETPRVKIQEYATNVKEYATNVKEYATNVKNYAANIQESTANISGIYSESIANKMIILFRQTSQPVQLISPLSCRAHLVIVAVEVV
jgi:hypothetical protein